ncbi:hypothetical protein BO82DRAFT_195786 [Aspergillus uvarum CBS 121591]|uniref:Uncharacterized protein n=1 Tax=Aspergillus uvarum CBS 121591 TaxID=1448315 RepID=A0A319BT01_9EURO|nr:hypothetical protein BO82DRAFT_195786 [Aspergillus uvarum CBS 121591]PYH76716.1 hypothetical protein BO82DRAFT_195786 [Aspergillus uvarum CBS 121591]
MPAFPLPRLPPQGIRCKKSLVFHVIRSIESAAIPENTFSVCAALARHYVRTVLFCTVHRPPLRSCGTPHPSSLLIR